MRTIEEFKAKNFLPGFFSKKRPFFLIPVSDTGVSFKVTDSFKEDYVALRFGIEPVYEGNAIHVLVWLAWMCTLLAISIYLAKKPIKANFRK